MGVKGVLEFSEGAHGIGGLPDGSEHGDAVKTELTTSLDARGVDASEGDHRGAARQGEHGAKIGVGELFQRPITNF
jgi:hypothetical protein